MIKLSIKEKEGFAVTLHLLYCEDLNQAIYIGIYSINCLINFYNAR